MIFFINVGWMLYSRFDCDSKCSTPAEPYFLVDQEKILQLKEHLLTCIVLFFFTSPESFGLSDI